MSETTSSNSNGSNITLGCKNSFGLVQSKLHFPKQDEFCTRKSHIRVHVDEDKDKDETKTSLTHGVLKALSMAMDKAVAKPTIAITLPLSQVCGTAMVKLTIRHCKEMDAPSLVFVINKWRGLRNISLVNVDFYMQEIQDFITECSRLTRLKFHFNREVDVPILEHLFKHCLQNAVIVDLDLHPMAEAFCYESTTLSAIIARMRTSSCRINSDKELVRLISWHLNAPQLRHLKLKLDKASLNDLGPILVKNVQRQERVREIAIDVGEWTRLFCYQKVPDWNVN